MDSKKDEEGQRKAKEIGSQPTKSGRRSSKSDDKMSDNSMDLSYADSSERDLSSDLMVKEDSFAKRPIVQQKWDNPYSYLLVRSEAQLKAVEHSDLNISPYSPNQLIDCKSEITNFNETPTAVENNERSERKLDRAESNDSSNFTGSEKIDQEAASSKADGLTEFVDDSESITLGSENQELLDGKISTSPHILNLNVEEEPEKNYHLMQKYGENDFYQQESTDYPLDDSLQLQNERHYLNLVVPSLSEISDTALEMVGPNPKHQMAAISPNAMEVDYPNQQSVPPGYTAMENGQRGENVDQKEREKGEDSFDEMLFDLNLEDEDIDQQERVGSKESSDENESPTPESKSDKFPYDSSAGITSQAGECDLLPFGINSILSHCHRLPLSSTASPTSGLEAGLIHCSSTISEHIGCDQTDEKELRNASGGSEEPKINDTFFPSLTSTSKNEQDKEEYLMNEIRVADKDLLQDLNQMEDVGCLNLQNSATNFIKSLEIKQSVKEIDQLSSEVADIKIGNNSPIQKGLLQRYSLDEELGSKDAADLKQNDYQLKQETIKDCTRSMSPRMKPTLNDLTQGFKETGMLSIKDGGEPTKKDNCDFPTASREDNLQAMSLGQAIRLNTTYQAASSSGNIESSTADSLGSPPSKEVLSAAHTLATLSRTFLNLGSKPVEPRPSLTQSQNSLTTSSACIVPLISRQGVPIKRKLSEEPGIPNVQVPCPKKQKLDVNKGTDKTPTSSIIQNHPTSGVKAKIQRSTSLGHIHVTPLVPLSAFTKGFQSLDSLPPKNDKKQSKNQSKKIGS